MWSGHYSDNCAYSSGRSAGSELELGTTAKAMAKLANVIFQPIQDRRAAIHLLARDQNTFGGTTPKAADTLIHPCQSICFAQAVPRRPPTTTSHRRR